MIRTALLFAIFVLSISNCEAQISLNDILFELIKQDSLPQQFEQSDQDQFLILVSRDIEILFNLKDTIYQGLSIHFFNSKEDIVNWYDLDNQKLTSLFVGQIGLQSRQTSMLEMSFLTGIIYCDKYFFKKDIPLLIHSNGKTTISGNVDPLFNNLQIIEHVY